MRKRRLAVIGGGWAGLAAAVEASQREHAVTLFEMAPQLGGRAKAVDDPAGVLDNGQHILIGAYVQTLRLMQAVGVDVTAALLRTPLRLVDPQGNGLCLPAGAPLPAFARAVWAQRRWRQRERLALLTAASGWALRRFRCDPGMTVAALTADLPAVVRTELIDPLCVAALNTASADASAQVFLRVLKDALFTGPGSADLLLPRIDLSAALPDPAARWLTGRGATLLLGQRVMVIEARGADSWAVHGEPFDNIVLATTPTEAARLVRPIAPDWAARATALRYEPIVTVYLSSSGTRLPQPMLALRSDAAAPAQFVFDRGQLGGPAGLLAFVISGAQPWVDQGRDATLAATRRQAEHEIGAFVREPLQTVRVVTEKHATFRCTPGLLRAPAFIAPRLQAAGDHVDGPYPATLEGAVRSGIAAVHRFG